MRRVISIFFFTISLLFSSQNDISNTSVDDVLASLNVEKSAVPFSVLQKLDRAIKSNNIDKVIELLTPYISPVDLFLMMLGVNKSSVPFATLQKIDNALYAENSDLAGKLIAPYIQNSSQSSNRFTIRENVFIDNKTGYMWQKRDSERELNWHEAKSYCENLVLDGYSDWKLPSRDEFHTLMTAYYGEWDSGWESWFEANKHKRNSGKTDPVFLPKEISQFFGWWYWTRDISKTNTSYSWLLLLDYGYDDYYNQYFNDFVRCVR